MSAMSALSATGIRKIPVDQLVVAHAALDGALRDPAITPSRSRLVKAVDLPEVGPELTVAAYAYVAEDGGSMRKFDGARAHETGWWTSYKRQAQLDWESITAKLALEIAETRHDVLWALTEPRRWQFACGGPQDTYTADLQLRLSDGTNEFVELKSDERSLANPDYRLTLAIVAELNRRCGDKFSIVLRDELFVDRHHRHNVELFASRRFAHVSAGDERRLLAHADATHGETTYGELAKAISPDWPAGGKAVVQALVARRQVEIDLTGLLTDATPLRIHPA